MQCLFPWELLILMYHNSEKSYDLQIILHSNKGGNWNQIQMNLGSNSVFSSIFFIFISSYVDHTLTQEQ